MLNLFRARLGSGTNLFVPHLHERLGIVIKIVEIINKLCTHLEEETNWTPMAKVQLFSSSFY